MKPVYQEIIEARIGDCFSACLASLLELPLSEVPKFRRDYPDNMMPYVQNWLKENFGLVIVPIIMAKEVECGDDMRFHSVPQGTPCIAAGKSPNLEGNFHAVVGEIDKHEINFRMTHDPNPSGKGIIGNPTTIYFLVPLRPENCKNV